MLKLYTFLTFKSTKLKEEEEEPTELTEESIVIISKIVLVLIYSSFHVKPLPRRTYFN